MSDALGEREYDEEARGEAEALNKASLALTAELDLQRLVQKVTDAGTALSGAKFGAFFYNVLNERGESYLLYSLSGAPREAFEKFGIPRNTPLFESTFRGQGVVRIDDVLEDQRYGKNPPTTACRGGTCRCAAILPCRSSRGRKKCWEACSLGIPSRAFSRNARSGS
jgi:hypothetical protein